MIAKSAHITPLVASLLTCLLGVIGCEATQGKAVQGAAIGSAVGAATGAVVGHRYHETGVGASVGAGLGGVTGGLAGSALEAQHKSPPPTAHPSSELTKFCPVGGEWYPASIKYCPLHGVELRERAAEQTNQ